MLRRVTVSFSVSISTPNLYLLVDLFLMFSRYNICPDSDLAFMGVGTAETEEFISKVVSPDSCAILDKYPGACQSTYNFSSSGVAPVNNPFKTAPGWQESTVKHTGRRIHRLCESSHHNEHGWFYSQDHHTCALELQSCGGDCNRNWKGDQSQRN